jgi:hypothetical protein
MMPRVKRSPLRRLETPWRMAVRCQPRVPFAGRWLTRTARHRPCCERHDLAARLHARPLLDQQELAALEVAAGLAQQDRGLDREDEVAVEVAVQAVVVARPVAQQQRRRPLLAAGMALASQAFRVGGKRRSIPSTSFQRLATAASSG